MILPNLITLNGRVCDYDSDGVDEALPIIYFWTLDFPDGWQGRYVGKSKNGAHSRLREYRNNLAKMADGRSYRKSDPDGWRVIHKALFDCLAEGGRVSVRLVANCSIAEINKIEGHYKIALEDNLGGHGIKWPEVRL